jgi:predicted nucleic acid-binding protein
LNRFVLDASVALSWFIDIPVEPYAAQVRERVRQGDRAVVPPLWELEFANGVLMAERRRIIDATIGDETLAEMERLRRAGVEMDSAAPTIRDVLEVSRNYQLTVYDAAYLELAQREALPLATLDKALRAAAGKAGVKLA